MDHDQAEVECEYSPDGSCESCRLPDGAVCPYEEDAHTDCNDYFTFTELFLYE